MEANQGGPFGAVIARDGVILAEGWNKVTSSNDPTAHAEVTAIRRACEAVGHFELKGATLYTSCEPCPMCLASAYWARVSRIVYANTRDEAAAKKKKMGKTREIEGKVASQYTKMQEIGGLLGRVLLAGFAVRIASRQNLLRIFQVPGLLLMPAIFALFLTIENRTFFVVNLEWILLGKLPVTTMSIGVLIAGLFTVAQFSFWGNYLPQVYPVHLRGTGESFAANIGGRMLGTSFAWVTATIAGLDITPGGSAPMKFAYTAAGVALFVYICGVGLSFLLPEPTPETNAE